MAERLLLCGSVRPLPSPPLFVSAASPLTSFQSAPPPPILIFASPFLHLHCLVDAWPPPLLHSHSFVAHLGSPASFLPAAAAVLPPRRTKCQEVGTRGWGGSEFCRVWRLVCRTRDMFPEEGESEPVSVMMLRSSRGSEIRSKRRRRRRRRSKTK